MIIANLNEADGIICPFSMVSRQYVTAVVICTGPTHVYPAREMGPASDIQSERIPVA